MQWKKFKPETSMKNINITINGKSISTTTGKTILEVINDHKIDHIPTLCHDDRLEPYGSCFVCVVEVKGMNRLVPSCSTPVSEGMEITTNNERIASSRKTALELLLSNHYADCIGPCIDNCPAHVDAQGYIALISMGKHHEALKLIKESNPLPLSIGRVCVRDCEEVCRRCYVDDPVAINFLKRYVADEDLANMWKPELKPGSGKKVAIIGGGPAGLTTAYYLTKEGHACTIFEKLPKMGGMLRYGIPSYRLPREILDAEIKWIADLGVALKNNTELGKDFTIDDLKDQGFDAIFLGIGAHKASRMRLDREDEISGIYGGIDFLREMETEGTKSLHGHVVVVGGGNTAIDAARTSLRCGAEEVSIVYRRSLNEMPAHRAEIEAALEEGVDIKFLTLPKALKDTKGHIDGIECMKMKLEEVKDGGRPKPIPIEGSEFFLPCDFLISAIGQGIEDTFLKQGTTVETNKWFEVQVNDQTMETSIEGIFSGGDVVTGPLTAISAIGQGKKAALAISEFLSKGKATARPKKFLSFKHKFGKISDAEFELCEKIDRVKMPELSLNDRQQNFEEVEVGLTDKQVEIEPVRCLECGCSEYFDCDLRKLSDDFQIEIDDYLGEVRKFKIDNTHPFIQLDPNKCINCGKCVRTCGEILKVSALGFVNRGFKAVVKPSMEKSLLETNCIGCGNCIDACPTGAISEKFPFKVLGTLPKHDHQSICNFCSIGCKINYKVIDHNTYYIANTTEKILDGVNNGYLCVKGRFGHRYLNGNHKVHIPLVRRNGQLHQVEMTEALETTAKRIKEISTKYGPDSVAVMVSPKMSNEELYILQKFSRTALGNNNISSFSNELYDVEVGALDSMLGATVSTLPIDAIDKSDVIVVINSNLSDENMIMELRIKQAQKKGAKLIVFNSAEIGLVKYADLWIDSKKGTHTILLNGLLNEIQKRNDRKLTGSQSFLSDFDPELMSDFTGISEEKYRELVELLDKESSNIVFVYNLDSIKEKSNNDLQAIGNFLALTDRIDKKDNGLILLREFANSTGLIDMGCHPDYLPGYVKADNNAEISRIGQIWGKPLESVFTPADIKRKLTEGDIKALLVFGEDPLLDPENERYLKGLEFLMTYDLFDSETVNKADVAIPANPHIFEHGTYTSCDTRIQEVKPMFGEEGNTQNWQIICQLAEYFSSGFNYKSVQQIFEEIRKVNRLYETVNLNDPWNQETSMQKLRSESDQSRYLNYKIDVTPFDPEKPSIHYSDYFYREKIRKVLTAPGQ
jgi:formate dehydrogenase major subunit